MSDYGRDEAMRDLDALHSWFEAAGGSGESHTGTMRDQLAAYIESLEKQRDWLAERLAVYQQTGTDGLRYSKPTPQDVLKAAEEATRD